MKYRRVGSMKSRVIFYSLIVVSVLFFLQKSLLADFGYLSIYDNTGYSGSLFYFNIGSSSYWNYYDNTGYYFSGQVRSFGTATLYNFYDNKGTVIYGHSYKYPTYNIQYDYYNLYGW